VGKPGRSSALPVNVSARHQGWTDEPSGVSIGPTRIAQRTQATGKAGHRDRVRTAAAIAALNVRRGQGFVPVVLQSQREGDVEPRPDVRHVVSERDAVQGRNLMNQPPMGASSPGHHANERSFGFAMRSTTSKCDIGRSNSRPEPKSNIAHSVSVSSRRTPAECWIADVNGTGVPAPRHCALSNTTPVPGTAPTIQMTPQISGTP